MKIALAQINPVVGDFEYNFSKMRRIIRESLQKEMDLLIFPELSLCGYPPEDLLFKPSFIKANRKYINKLSREVKGEMVVIAGFVYQNEGGTFNSAGVLSGGKVKDVYSKILLPNYGVFDEKRYFHPGKDITVYVNEDIKIGLTICEDIWGETVVSGLRKENLDLVVNISASPFYSGKLSLRKKFLASGAKKLSSFILYCNLAGAQDELIFDGTSMVINPRGETILQGKRFSEDFITFDTQKKYRPVKLRHNPVEDICRALVLGVEDYVSKNNFEKVVVGVSGGIDSALTLAIAKLALGRENVLGLIMPSQYTSKETLSDAVKVCKNLGVKHSIISIKDIYGSFMKELSSSSHLDDFSLAAQNLQARIRGNILMSFSNQEGYLVLNTGNKSEVSVGYCTLYGDMVGGFGVLKDVYKTKVYKLASFINKISRKKVIPQSIIKRSPSAELKPNQKDEDELAPYSLLDRILKLYIEKDECRGDIIKKGFNPKIVRKILSMVDRNEYKRRQAPPGIKITPKSFGKDRRMPITCRFSS